jgi:hypothetical protein
VKRGGAGDDDDDDLSLEGGVDKAESPAITRSAIRRKQKAAPSSGKAAPAAKKRKSQSQAATASSAATADEPITTENDAIKKIVYKALAYGLEIYQCAWLSGSSTWEFPCDLNGEGYGAMIDAFNKSWGSRELEKLDESKWPKQDPPAGLVPEAILDVGYCKHDMSMLVQWQASEATWERVTDMYIYGFGKLVKKFLKAWGDKPIRDVIIDDNSKEVVSETPYRPARQTKRSQQAQQESDAAAAAASAVKVKEEPVSPSKTRSKKAPAASAKKSSGKAAKKPKAAAPVATPRSSPRPERELEEEPLAEDDESAELSSETEQSGPSLSDHESDDAEAAEDDGAPEVKKITAKVLKEMVRSAK